MPLQSIVIAGVFFFNVSMKCNASYLAVYFTPRSSRTKLNIVYRVACLNITGVKPAWVYF